MNHNIYNIKSRSEFKVVIKIRRIKQKIKDHHWQISKIYFCETNTTQENKIRILKSINSTIKSEIFVRVVY